MGMGQDNFVIEVACTVIQCVAPCRHGGQKIANQSAFSQVHRELTAVELQKQSTSQGNFSN